MRRKTKVQQKPKIDEYKVKVYSNDKPGKPFCVHLLRNGHPIAQYWYTNPEEDYPSKDAAINAACLECNRLRLKQEFINSQEFEYE